MITQFPNFTDLDIVYRLVEERADREYPLIWYRKIVLQAAEIDDVHNEIDEREKDFSTPVQIRGYVEPDEETFHASKFPIEVARNVVLWIDVPHLLRANLATQNQGTKEVRLLVDIGDRFIYSGYEYDVLQIGRGHMWCNTDIPIDFKLRAEKFRPFSSDYAGT